MLVEEPSINYSTGWIKLYRSIQNKGWYLDSEYVHLWIHILTCANHSGKEFLFNGEIIKLKAGQFVTGRKKLSEETGIDESKIERILKCFESEQQIEQQTNSRNRILSIVSWDVYQNVEQQMNNKRTTGEQLVNTNKNDNNKENIYTSLRSDSFEKFWEYYGKKGSKKVSKERFMKLSETDIEAIRKHLPAYIKSTPDRKYRKDAERYLSNRLWENGDIEELKEHSVDVGLPSNWWHIDLTPEQWKLVPKEHITAKRNADTRRAMGV